MEFVERRVHGSKRSRRRNQKAVAVSMTCFLGARLKRKVCPGRAGKLDEPAPLHAPFRMPNLGFCNWRESGKMLHRLERRANPMSEMGPGCVKTPTSNLRVESLSQ